MVKIGEMRCRQQIRGLERCASITVSGRTLRCLPEGRPLSDTGSVTSVAFSPDGRTVASGDVTIRGHCNRCGACCLNRKCLFLEQTGEKEYICGIYGTTLRKFTNCGPYPQSQFDIDLYDCPTYYVFHNIPVRTYPDGIAAPARKSR